MEFRDYLKMYWSQRWLIGIVMALATATTFIVASSQPVRYESSESFAINRINPEPTADYQYDGYYALQAVDLFSQTVVSWFDTPSAIAEIYQQAQLDPEIDALSKLPSRFHVKRYSAQNIVVRFTERSEQRAHDVAAAVKAVLQNRSQTLNQDAQGRPIFEINGSTAVVSPSQPNPWLYASVALVLSFGLGLLLAAARHYLR